MIGMLLNVNQNNVQKLRNGLLVKYLLSISTSQITFTNCEQRGKKTLKSLWIVHEIVVCRNQKSGEILIKL